MVEVDCSMYRTGWHGSSRGEVRVELEAWDAGPRQSLSDEHPFLPRPCHSAESMLPKPNKLFKRGLRFHVRVTFDPRLRPAWRQPPWRLAAVAPWSDDRHGPPAVMSEDGN